MNENPLITIVIPVYNVENYLTRCVNSVIGQTYKNLEIILVDDGSKDSSGIICDNYKEKDNRIVVIHKSNGGLSSARNIGIDSSHGEYISFVDSDDWVSPDYIKYLYHLLEKTGADLAMGSHITTSSVCTFSQNKYKEKVISSRDFLLKILKYDTQENVQYAWGKLYKNFKETALRYPEGLIDEDVPTTFKYVSNINKVAISTKIIYAYFENKASILRQKFTRKRFDLIKVWKITADYAKENCDSEIAKYAKINYYRANFGTLCNICTKEIDESDKEYINREENKALQIVKKHKKELLDYPMPLSRKIMVVAFCTNYRLVKEFAKRLHVKVNI